MFEMKGAMDGGYRTEITRGREVHEDVGVSGLCVCEWGEKWVMVWSVCEAPGASK